MSRSQVVSSFAAASRVDREHGMIYGVSVITEGEAKGHDMYVDGRTLQTVKECAETYQGGLKVKADHWGGIFSTVGFLQNFRIDGQSLRADLHLLATEGNREKICEMAERMPQSFGLSISFSNSPEMINQRRYARCIEIYSADIVDTPAANPHGLFSSVGSGSGTGSTAMASTGCIRTGGIITSTSTLLAMTTGTGMPGQTWYLSVDSGSGDMSAENFTALSKQLTDLATKFESFLAQLADAKKQTDALAAQFGELKTALSALDPRLAALEKHKAELETVIANTAKSTLEQLSAKLGTSGAPAAGGDNDKTKEKPAEKNFAAHLAEYTAANPKAGREEAIRFCIGKFPKEYTAWKQAGGDL